MCQTCAAFTGCSHVTKPAPSMTYHPQERMLIRYRFVFIIFIHSLTWGCDTALDPTTEPCHIGIDEQYCADEDTIMQCTGCRDHNSSYHCWKETGCYEPFKCRYRFKNAEQEESFAQCIRPDDERYNNSFAEDPLDGKHGVHNVDASSIP